MNLKKIASVDIQSHAMFIDAALHFLDAIAAHHTHIDFSRYNRLRYVVGEILAHRVKNAYPGSVGMIELSVSLGDGCCEVSIRDKGVPAWTDFSYEDDADVHNETAMRNYLLDLWTDDIGIEQLGKDGQRIFVRMNVLHPFAFQKPEPYAETEVLDTNISIKPVETEADALEAIRCIYSEYGYSYSYEKLYYLDRFMDMIKNKELMSFLAVNEHGQTAGHFALSFSDTFKNMPEITTVVTRKEFRGLGLFAKFMDYCLALGKELGFRAFMGQPVAFHPMSQKAFLKSGFTATSVLLSYISADIESEYNRNHQRLDLFASVKILDPTARTVVYPPAPLCPFIDRMFAKLGWDYELREDIALSERTEICVENHGFLKATKVRIDRAADDLASILRDTTKDAIRRKSEMIEMLVSLNDPSCTHAYDTARKSGFVLSGLIPGGERGDYLVMQMLIGADCRYDQLVTVGEFEDLTRDIAAFNS